MTQNVSRRSLAPLIAMLAMMYVAPAFAATPAPAPASTDTVTAGDLTATHPSFKYKSGSIDVFISIKNAGKIDETIIGAGTPWSDGDVVEVKKDKDGKETESPVSIPLPAGKTTDLSEDEKIWLRVKDVKTEPKETDVMPFGIYTRRSPNLNLKIAAKDSKSGGLMDWLKK